MQITCVSDLHGHYPKLEGGDLLIVAGDLTSGDTPQQNLEFFDWLYQQNYKGIIFIAGNHDRIIEKDRYLFRKSNPDLIQELIGDSNVKVQYLCDSGTEFEGIKIWGSPWTKTFPGMNPKCKAFTCDTEQELIQKFNLIPEDTDILITHSPPYRVLDRVKGRGSVGSTALYNWIRYVGRPRLHVFGHIHEAYGKAEVFPTYKDKMMISVNASHVNEGYEPVNKPIRVEL